MDTIFYYIRGEVETDQDMQGIEGLDLNLNSLLYADDTLLITGGKYTAEKMLKLVVDYSGAFGLNLNKDKCVNIQTSKEEESEDKRRELLLGAVYESLREHRDFEVRSVSFDAAENVLLDYNENVKPSTVKLWCDKERKWNVCDD